MINPKEKIKIDPEKRNHKVNNLDEFLKLISASNLFFNRLGKGEFFIFRGQANDYDLTPKISRDQYLKSDTPLIEKEIYEDFKRNYISYYNNIHSLDDWDILALAQHHWLPTRLLDWTENPLIALFFALNEEESKSEERYVWAFWVKKDYLVDTRVEGPFKQDKTVVYRPRQIATRISSQFGWFTCHKYNEKNKAFTRLNKHKDYNEKLFKITFEKIDKKKRKEILLHLNTLGINSSTIFRDLDGLCKYLEWKYFKK